MPMFLKLTDDVNAKRKIGKRFGRIRESLGLCQDEMAAHFGLTQTCIAHFERGTVIPGPGHLEILSRKFRVDVNWLLFGRGTMFQRSDALNRLYDELEKNYRVPEVALVLDATLQESRKRFSEEIAEYFMRKEE